MTSTKTSTAPGRLDAQALGPLLATYGKSRSFLVVGWSMAALFAAVGAFVLWLSTRIGPDLRFSGDVSLLYLVGFGALALGAASGGVVWRLAASQATFQLFDKGIRASGPDGDTITLYRDLEDLYSFFYGGIGYRASPRAPWTFIGSRIHRFAELSERLRSLQIAQRGEALHRQLDAGQPVIFRYVEERVAQSKSLVASRNMDFPTFELSLTAERLQIGQDSIDIARIAAIETDAWTEQSGIVDVDGAVFHKMHPRAILSFELLQTLIARRQQA